MTTFKYAAYGMNTDPEAMKMRTGNPVPIGAGIIRDHAFRFAVHADVYPCVGVNTNVVLWEITQDHLAALDLREGYPTYYDRKMVDVEMEDGTVHSAWMYYMTPGQPVHPPSDGYYAMLDRGYTAFGVPKTQIVESLAASIVEYASTTEYQEF